MDRRPKRVPARPELPWELVKANVVIAAFYDKDLALDIRNALLDHGIKTVLRKRESASILISLN